MKISFGVPEQNGILKQSSLALGIVGGHKAWPIENLQECPISCHYWKKFAFCQCKLKQGKWAIKPPVGERGFLPTTNIQKSPH